MLPSPSPSSQDTLRERLGRKLTKRKPDHRSSSLDMPDRLKHGDDAMADVTAPRPGSKQYMNQSLFNMITAAGSTADFHTRFDEGSSESEAEAEHVETATKPHKLPKHPKLADVSEAAESSSSSDSNKHKHRRASSKQLLMRSMQKLHLRPGKERKGSSELDHMSSSQILAPRPKHKSPAESISGDAPLLRRMLKGEAEMQASDNGDSAAAKEGILVGKKRKQTPVTLAERLKEIFGLEEPEEVISGAFSNGKFLIKRRY
jgi:sterol 3beta-glucosyltransferase